MLLQRVWRMAALMALILVQPALAGATRVGSLRCEYLQNPLGIDSVRPRLSWQLVGDARGVRQCAYQILVSSTPELLASNTGDLWDSGKIPSSDSIQIEYAGEPLGSQEPCFWKVRVWDGDDKPTDYSEPALWSMGLLYKSDWTATWIGLEPKPAPAPTTTATTQATPPAAPKIDTSPEARRLPARYMRREFDASRKVTRATAFICGLGLSELFINGRKISDDLLSPAATDFDKRTIYVTYDVTGNIQAGKNAVGVILGNGRYYSPRIGSTHNFGYPKLLLQIQVQYDDGSTSTIVSDGRWKVTDGGPIRANNEYDGEDYDARINLDGFSTVGFDDAKWQTVQTVEAPSGQLAAQMVEPIRAFHTFTPIAITSPKPGAYIFDMGQNLVGWCQLTVSGPAGTVVTLRHAERLMDGKLYTDNLRSARATDTYTLKGGGEETFEPRFTFHGFRYVEMTGYPGTPTLESLKGVAVSNRLTSTAYFSCSNPLLNQLASNIYWGVIGNYHSVPTDCPQRDERQGWMGDRAEESRGEAYLFDIGALYSKWLNDIFDDQRSDGALPVLAPIYWPENYHDDVSWPSLAIIVPGVLYDQYGDRRAMERHYTGMSRWIDRMVGKLKDGITAADEYGDWCVPPERPDLIHSEDPARRTSKEVVASSYLFHDLKLMARYATVLGKTEDAAHFDKIAEQIKTAFNAKFFDPKKDQYDNGTQTSFVLPLAFGMVPPEHKKQVFENLAARIVAAHNHLATGLIGGQWLMRVLSDNGRPDLAAAIALQTDYPSWGYMVKNGATTMWELWNGNTADPGMNSGNHVMLVGDLYIWFMQDLGGIRPDPKAPGFKHIIIKPTPVAALTSVDARFDSIYGPIESNWHLEGGKFHLEVNIPANTTATVYVPSEEGAPVTASSTADQTAEAKFVENENGAAAVFEIESGNYSFESKLPEAGKKESTTRN
jgi:alpha-L-rhamnosidase